MPRALIVGYGLVGSALAPHLVGLGYEVCALRRSEVSSTPENVKFVSVDMCDLKKMQSDVPDWKNFDLVFFLAAPNQFTEEAYKKVYDEGMGNILKMLEGGNTTRFIFCSSTSVYGQRDGVVVDETSETVPALPTSRVVLQAEKRVLDASVGGLVVRSGGIHCAAEGRHPLISRVQSNSSGTGVCANLIHLTDLVRIMIHLAKLNISNEDNGIYLAVQDEVPEDWTIQDFIADALGVQAPEHVVPERVGSSRRASNTKIKDTGFSFVFPTYRESYTNIMEELGLLKKND